VLGRGGAWAVLANASADGAGLRAGGAGPEAGWALAWAELGLRPCLGQKSFFPKFQPHLKSFLISAKSIIYSLVSYLYKQVANMFTPLKGGSSRV